MKCPKCGYVGFETVDKCRNCGYDFSLLDDRPSEIDLLLRPEEPSAPADLSFSHIAPPTPSARVKRSGDGDLEAPSRTPKRNESSAGADLPLFGPDTLAPTTPLRQLGARAAARNATPPPPRLRPRSAPGADSYPRPIELGLEAATPADRAAAPLRRRMEGQPAGPIARALAGLIDAAILGSLDLGVLYFTLRVCRLSFAETSILPFAPLIAFFLILDGAYLVAFTANGGQTIGKMATNIRVTGEDDEPVAASQAFVRALGYIASGLPAFMGFVPGLFGPTRRALHDRLANTRVVRL